MNIRGHGGLECCGTGFRFQQGHMEVLRFFTAMLQILCILRISTGQGFRKEKPVHDVYIG